MTPQQIVDAWNKSYEWGKDFVAIVGEGKNGYPADPGPFEPMNGRHPAFLLGDLPMIRLHGKADPHLLARTWVINHWRDQPPRLDEIPYVRHWRQQGVIPAPMDLLELELWIDGEFVHMKFADSPSVTETHVGVWEERAARYWEHFMFQPKMPVKP